MISRAEWVRVAVLSAVVLAVVSAPYVLAYLTASPDTFTGIIFNPADGHSYLAKMRAGWRGEWLFTLPYTAEPGEGVFLFTYYLFLGHVARWLGLSTDLVYHLARVLGGAAFLFAAYRFLAHFFATPAARLGAWLFFFTSSGLGWLFAMMGLFTADLWVAESIPFLTLFSNAHFPLAWALMLWIIETVVLLPHRDAESGERTVVGKRLSLAAVAVTALAIVQPMTLVPVNAVVAWEAAWDVWRSRRVSWRAITPALIVAAFSAPWVLYALWVANTHPVLKEWNRQNVTLSPPGWEALIWGGGVLALAIVGARGLVGAALAAARGQAQRGHPQGVPVRWVIIGVVLMYLPLDLQRRMSIGLWMPLSILAVWALREVIAPRLAPRWRLLALTALMLPTLFSNVLVFAASTFGVLTRKPELYLTPAEAGAMDWLATQPGQPLVVASPATALILPGRTDARVIYGHPFETVHAAQQEAAVLGFLRGETAPAEFLSRNHVDFVFDGPRERALNPEFELSGWQVAFEQGDVKIYER